MNPPPLAPPRSTLNVLESVTLNQPRSRRWHGPLFPSAIFEGDSIGPSSEVGKEGRESFAAVAVTSIESTPPNNCSGEWNELPAETFTTREPPTEECY